MAKRDPGLRLACRIAIAVGVMATTIQLQRIAQMALELELLFP